MSIRDLERKEVRLLEPYMTGQSIEKVKKKYNLKEIYNLSTNESMIGPSTIVQNAIQKELYAIHYYPDGSNFLLREDLAQRYSIEADQIIVTNGGDELIFLLGGGFISTNDEVIMGEYGFSTYEIVSTIYGAKIVKVPLHNGHLDLNGIAEQITGQTKMIFLCNPYNPDGTIFTQKELERFLEKVPEHTIIILDEAYADFVESEDYPNSIQLLRENRHHILILRTFSKIGGIAGLRVGFGMASPEIISSLRKVQPPYSVNRLAQVAARAFLTDQEYRIRLIQNNQAGKKYLYQQFDRLNLFYHPTQANFIFVNLKKEVNWMCRKLAEKGIIIRSGQIWEKETWARITIGTEKQNEHLIKSLEFILRNGEEANELIGE